MQLKNWALQAAEKLNFTLQNLHFYGFCNKGTASAGPQMLQNKRWASSPANLSQPTQLGFGPFSAACKALQMMHSLLYGMKPVPFFSRANSKCDYPAPESVKCN